MALLLSGELRKRVTCANSTRGPLIGDASSSVQAVASLAHASEAWLPGTAEDILTRRRSVREFAPGELTIGELAAVVDRARQAERMVWPGSVHGDVDFMILAAAYRVAPLAPGLYLLKPAAAHREETAVPISAGIWVRSLRDEYVEAPCLLFVCADFSPACRDDGSGYAALVVRAGTLGHAAWLSAVGLGLAGCVYGPSHFQVTEAARGLDPRFRHLFTVAIGRPRRARGNQ